MSDSGLNFKGRPNTDNIETLRILRYCGGSGGGDCLEPLGVEGIVLPYRVPKYITYNRKIIFHNNEFFGIRIYNDGGPAGFCSHSLGSPADFYIGLAADPNLDMETTAKAGLFISRNEVLPYDIEFDTRLCPQPDDPAWENIVYVYVWWGDSSFMAEGGDIDVGSITLTKHDKDSKI